MVRFQEDPTGAAAEGGGFYVSVVDGQRFALVLGPFSAHQEAKASVERVRSYVTEHDWRGAFYAYGTSRVRDGELPAGRLNSELGLVSA